MFKPMDGLRCARSSQFRALALMMLCSRAAHATNGYLMDGYGVKALGLAGVSVALPQDSLAAASNPGGTGLIGNRLDIGASLFAPDYNTDIVGNGYGVSGHYGGSLKKFLIPEIGFSHTLGSTFAAGVSIYGNGGITTEYDTNPFGAFGGQGRAGVALQQLFVTPSIAWRPGGHQSIGIALDFTYQTFSAEGLNAFATSSADAANLTDRGTDTSTGVGVKLGWTGQVLPGLTAGLSYSSKIGTSRFKDYSGLFAQSGSFDVPEIDGVGLSYVATPELTLAIDGQRLRYSGVPAVGNPLANLFAGNPLGSANGPGFGWRDVEVVKFGVQYAASTAWIIRIGYSHSGQPIPENQTFFNILAPAVIQNHIAIGATWKISAGGELSFAYTDALTGHVNGRQSIPAPFGGGNANISLGENILSVAYGWKL
jgi:long-chain fatty acid transport protein